MIFRDLNRLHLPGDLGLLWGLYEVHLPQLLIIKLLIAYLNILRNSNEKIRTYSAQYNIVIICEMILSYYHSATFELL